MPTLTPLVLNDCRIYMESADLTGWSNKVDLAASVADEKTTTFASQGWEERVGGLFDTSGSVDGFFEAGDLTKPDDSFWSQLGSAQAALTIVPTSGAGGSLAYLTRAMVSDYKPGASVGKLLGWSASVKGNWPLVRGQIIHPTGVPRTTTGATVGYQLGALTAAQRLYVCAHVLSVAGTGTPTITIKIQSSVDNTFAAPADRLTFAADTTVDGQAISLLGPVTDQWWRVSWTISGTAPSFLFAVSAGIAAK